MSNSPETNGNGTRRRWRFGIAMTLMAGFGGLFLVALTAVLMVSLATGQQNTLQLLRQVSESRMEQMITGIDNLLRAPADQLIFLEALIRRGSIDPADTTALQQAMTGSLAATPDVAALVFADARRGSILRLIRNPDGVETAQIGFDSQRGLRDQFERRLQLEGMSWGEPVRPPGADVTLVNVQLPVERDGQTIGLLIATVQVGKLSQMVEDIASETGGSGFMLYGNDLVLAHPLLIGNGVELTAEHPLPTAAELGDPIVSAFLRSDEAEFALAENTSGPTRFRQLKSDSIVGIDESFIVLHQELVRYGPKPWTIAIYYPQRAVSSELLRLLWAFVIGIGVLVVALALAWLIARAIARPLGDLAAAAERVRDLDIEKLGTLRGSRIREFDETAEAFNAMVGGLRWFEHYVPRKLVQRLIQGGEDYARHSMKRELTVMFTDIADFTAQSETLNAEDVRSFLNEHFALLAACIEHEGGTIDKFIGDAIMAFWGAPKKMEDHAERACRAALAIREAIEADNRARVARGDAPVRMRIGIHTGEVVVGNIGAPDRVNYTIVGDPVNTANRLEALGKELHGADEQVCILASSDTADAAGDGFSFETTGTHVLRGRAQGLEILHLVGGHA